MTDHPHPDLEDVAKAIQEAHQAENALHDMAPFQFQTPNDYVVNGFDPNDHKPED